MVSTIFSSGYHRQTRSTGEQDVFAGCLQFTSADFVAAVKGCCARHSMDGRGCWRDNVFVERLWRSVKYKEV